MNTVGGERVSKLREMSDNNSAVMCLEIQGNQARASKVNGEEKSSLNRVYFLKGRTRGGQQGLPRRKREVGREREV